MIVDTQLSAVLGIQQIVDEILILRVIFSFYFRFFRLELRRAEEQNEPVIIMDYDLIILPLILTFLKSFLAEHHILSVGCLFCSSKVLYTIKTHLTPIELFVESNFLG